MSTTNSLNSAPTFAGGSTYSAQLQQVITHAVAIASLPATQLQAQQASLQGEQNELQSLNSSFATIQSAISSLGSATGLGSFAADVSDPSVATASISTGVLAGSYSLNVIGIGSHTNTVSSQGLHVVTDPSSSNIDSSSTYTLTVNGTSFAISNANGSLNGLAQAITDSPANVQASVVNLGSSSAPDYRLSIQGLDYAPDSIQLSNGTRDLLTTLSSGTNVTYQVNGQPDVPISSSSRSVILSTGLTVQLSKIGTTEVTVAQSSTNVANALSAFATGYNSIVAALAHNRGQNGGALSGQSIVYQLQDRLRDLVGFSSSSGSIHSLSDLGLSFDSTGNLQFDLNAFQATAATEPNDLLNFIGTTTSGGFLQAANDMLSATTDPLTGILTQASSSVTSELSDIGGRINDEQDRVAQLQKKLTDQMATVDATISSLEQRLTEVTSLFDQMQTNARLYNN